MTQAMWGYLMGMFAWALQLTHPTRHAHHPAVALRSNPHGTHTLHNTRKASPLASIPRQKTQGSLLAKNPNRGNSNPGFERDMLIVKSCFCWVFC